MGWVFLASLEKLVLHEKKIPPSKFYLLGRFIEFGRIREGVGSFFGGKPHLKTEQKTLRPWGFPEETL